MLAICKKEILSCMNSMVGCVFIALLLALCGVYFTAYHLNGAYPKFSYTLQGMSVVFLIAVPILTMRSLAEERRQKTDQLLLTSPVSVPRIVFGKYLALVGIFAIPMVVICFYPLILRAFGSISFRETYTGVFGFFLMGCAYLSIGLLVSSLTESTIISAVICFLVLFLTYLMDGIENFFPSTSAASFISLLVLFAILSLLIWHWTKNSLIGGICLVGSEAACAICYRVSASSFQGVIQKILDVFYISGRFSNFADGIFDIDGVVYFLLVIVICLFLTVQSIQKRRWS